MGFLLTLIFFFIALGKPLTVIHAAAPMPVVIINQIRGSETCCQPGDEQLETQILNENDFSQLDISYALRFDALQEEKLVKPLKSLDSGRLGILLEVTPNLASASGVTYKGEAKGSDWYHARNAFLIGYTQDERKKLIDTAVSEFKTAFGVSPRFSVAWMIDAYSLGYLRNQYGIFVHELTKEQFETDNYTLYGGIFNLPYFASKNHPLLPSTDQTGTLILRQTISDIEKNYGSFKAYYTSQPNDYLSNPSKGDLSYFKALLETAGKQTQNSQFALLGLENSQALHSAIPEFISQLRIIDTKQVADEVKVISPYAYYQTSAKAISPGRFLASADFPQNGVLWYFGETYRARLEAKDGKLALTDLRIFNQNLVDPYQDDPALVSRAYWIMPYLIDSSQEFTQKTKSGEFAGNPVRTDPGVDRFNLNLDISATDMVPRDQGLELRHKDKTVLILTPLTIQCMCEDSQLSFPAPLDLNFAQLLKQNTQQYVTINAHPRFYLSPSNSDTTILAGWEGQTGSPVVVASFVKKGQIWEIVPKSYASASELGQLASVLQPDKNLPRADIKNTVFYWNNTEAIAGRNPIRLYIDPRTTLNRPTVIKRLLVTTDNDGFKVNSPDATEILMEPFFADITASMAGVAQVSINVDGDLLPQKTSIRFYHDCVKDVPYCLKHLDELKGYVGFLVQEQFRLHQKDIEKYTARLKGIVSDKVREFLPKLLPGPASK